jgi:chromosome segregation ATPase
MKNFDKAMKPVSKLVTGLDNAKAACEKRVASIAEEVAALEALRTELLNESSDLRLEIKQINSTRTKLKAII